MTPQLSDNEIDDLLYSARTGDNDELTTLLTALAEREKVLPAEILASARDEGKSTCLHMATGNGHLDTVAHLLSYFTPSAVPASTKQAFLDAPNEYGNTGLHWAALGGHLDVVKLLVEHGASPALANDKNYVPLDLASFNDKFEVVDYFLAQSGGLESRNANAGAAAGDEGLSGAVEGLQLGEDEGEEEGDGEEDGAEGSGKGKGKAKKEAGESW